MLCASEVKQQQVIVFVGTPCSGKTTLAKKLYSVLDKNEWEFVELDQIAETLQARGIAHAYWQACKQMPTVIREKLGENKSVLVDTTMWSDNLECLKQQWPMKKILIYAPLWVLLERNRMRSMLGNGTPEKKREQQILMDFASACTYQCTDARCLPIGELCAADIPSIDQIQKIARDGDALDLDEEEKSEYKRASIFYQEAMTAVFIPKQLFSANPVDLVVDTSTKDIDSCVGNILTYIRAYDGAVIQNSKICC